MSQEEGEEFVDSGTDREFSNGDFLWVLEMALEPSYISEIARKLQMVEAPIGLRVMGPEANLLVDDDNNVIDSEELIDRTWADFEENTAVRMVGSIVNMLQKNEGLDIESQKVQYDVTEGDASYGESLSHGSVHESFAEEGSFETDDWRDYKIVYNDTRSGDDLGMHFHERGLEEIAEEVRDVVDPAVTIEEKVRSVKAISRLGNDVSRNAERIMQDVMERQFREYEKLEYGDYNDPGVDFYVEDTDRRDYGLAIEVSVRWVNPIGTPYVEEKENKAIKYDGDLAVLAPKFTDGVMVKYENLDDDRWHEEPEESIVHLHEVPGETERVYRPFAVAEMDISDRGGVGGNPIIVPDSEKLRNWLKDRGHVGNDYPIVEDDGDSFINLLEGVNRDFFVVTESEYRHMLREAIEPLLWEFLRPYKIEQFLIDMYWDKGLAQSDIGSLVHYGSGTIGRWMREWGVMRRGTGAPELSEDTKEIWKRMYEGEDPFQEQFSGYRIQAEYNRHPLWDLEDWKDWYESTTEEERKSVMSSVGSFREDLDYTAMVGPKDRLLPSYTFILRTLKDMGVDVRDPDEAPRVPYSAYPSRKALEYMINRNEDTITEV